MSFQPYNTVTESFDAKVAGIWNLLIRWNMQGLDVKIDTNAGALFSRLGTTLTTLTEDNPIIDDESEEGRSMARYKLRIENDILKLALINP